VLLVVAVVAMACVIAYLCAGTQTSAAEISIASAAREQTLAPTAR
jgi:hypothetical protein